MANEFEVEKLIFEQYQKPKNYLATKVINVYNNRYRINIYHEIFDAELNIHKKRMHSSYFCKYDNGKLEVLYPKTHLDNDQDRAILENDSNNHY